MIVFGSLFSGIGGFDLGFERAGMRCAWQCEIDAAARGVLTRQFGKPIIEDVRDVRNGNIAAVDLVCGGFPCQDLSVAGKRAGLAGERSGLWFEFRRVLDELRPQWVVIENVPGLLSSNGGADFAVILRGLVELRYGVAWRVLDAQYFGVAQLRRRVFIVGSLGDGRASQVLFESEGLFGHPPARREVGQGVAGTLRGGAAGGSSHGKPSGTDRGTFAISGFGGYKPAVGTLRANGGDYGGGSEMLVVAYNIQHNDGGEHRRKDRPEGGFYVNETDTALTVGTTDLRVVASTLNHHHGRIDGESETFIFEPRFARNGRGAPDTIAPPLKAENGQTGKGDGAPVVAFHTAGFGASVSAQASTLLASDSRLSNQVSGIIQNGIRRLTPTECERLQGFPDGWTDGQSDSARYRQLGNAVAVPVIEWIGRRIAEADSGSGVPVPE
jgi:DNA (cytosine-5)-methyltransferase 1